jgi:hypothetical protein
MTTQTQFECPICMDVIDINKNSVTTECGHCFHSNCLMTSVAHNGFACPYCRTSMAVVPDKKEVDDEENWSITSEENEEMFLDYTLRGLRFFFNNINGDEHDEDDIEDEDEDEEVLDEEIKPSCELIAQKFIEQGVTMEYLIKALLSFHPEYENDDMYSRACGEIYGKVRVIISNYTPPEPEQATQQPVVVADEEVVVADEEVVVHYPVVYHHHHQAVADVDYTAQSKKSATRT